MNTLRDERYKSMVKHLRETREKLGITQIALAERLQAPQSYVAKVETRERRLDILELYDWIIALDYSLATFFEELEWIKPAIILSDHLFPEPKKATEENDGIILSMKHPGGISQVFIHGATKEKYLMVEEYIVGVFQTLNKNGKDKNRDAIYHALVYAIRNMPDANPSDVYQHIVYRLYLREYKSGSNPEQSWRRAGGEAMELFVQHYYQERLEKEGIRMLALISGNAKKAALLEMGLGNKIGGSKLDIALYGLHNEEWVIFGGVHCKSSLAERVSDDVPASQAMMRKGLVSVLYTFDSKSFPPPTGDLVNRGELGTLENPSDKRKYMEEHGSFDACFSYNTRGTASGGRTKSGKKIYVSDLKPENDALPPFVIDKWKRFKDKLNK